MLIYHINEIGIPELSDAKTDPTKNLQDNGAKPLVGTKPSFTHSPLEDTLVAPDKPPPCSHIESGDAALQARMGYLPDVCLLGADDMLFSIYQDWVHQKPRDHLDGGITEDGK